MLMEITTITICQMKRSQPNCVFSHKIITFNTQISEAFSHVSADFPQWFYNPHFNTGQSPLRSTLSNYIIWY